MTANNRLPIGLVYILRLIRYWQYSQVSMAHVKTASSQQGRKFRIAHPVWITKPALQYFARALNCVYYLAASKLRSCNGSVLWLLPHPLLYSC